MNKIISSFEAKKKTLSPQKEKELLEVIEKTSEKIRETSTIYSEIAQLKSEIQQLSDKTDKISLLELKKKKQELKELEKKDTFQIYQELVEKLSPQKIEKQEKRKPTKIENQKWEEIQAAFQKMKKATRLLLCYSRNFVKYIERGYYYFGKVDTEDLTTEGVFSLLKAIEKFKPTSENRLSTFSGYRIRQAIKGFIDKNQLIQQPSGSKEKKRIVYYDSNYQSDKENTSYSLMDILSDPESSNLENKIVHQQDVKNQTNNLLNSLDSRETNLVVRLFYNIVPNNLLDIYCLATPTEKEELIKTTNLGDRFKNKTLQKLSLKTKKINQIEIVQKYLKFFSSNPSRKDSSKIALLLNLSKKEVERLKSVGFEQVKKMAQERNLHLFL
ncbi:MAG: RNA polymerase sigma 32 subunit [Mycoplasmataceae bacterium RC_NB112A]|nr:MAG: RNA polymerase sigma 32 subunit [Mycoplasmataceae bacterium RC_NB112A]